jgi:deoxyribodipyrimidine photo-lyase
MTALCWFRTDLRSFDNPALTAALQSGPAYAVFVVAPEQWRLHHDAPAKIHLWWRALESLAPELEKIGVALKILRVQTWQDVPQAMLELCQTLNIDTVHCNREHGLNERRRDQASYKILAEAGINLIGHDGNTLLPPSTVKTGNNDYYRVFTPFSKACRLKLKADKANLITPQPACAEQPLPGHMVPDDLATQWPETEASSGLSDEQRKNLSLWWPASSVDVMARLEAYAQAPIDHYKTKRDLPAQPGTSQMSPYLASGLVSARVCLYQALKNNTVEIDKTNEGVHTWVNEILWREFYQHLLHGYPKLSMHKPLRDDTIGLPWRDAPNEFDAWCKGQTGIPIVDAAMRQLITTGWMHNRLRMVVAMFLTKNLLIDWQKGEAFFMQHLIDGDLAANNGGWQWSASTGADSAPYFRVFNPVSQSEKFDADGLFIKKWLPELASLDSKSIHDPAPLQRQSLNYPMAMVDLKSSRVRAIEAFKNHLKNDV